MDASLISIHVCSKTLLHYDHLILDVSWHDNNTIVLTHIETQFLFRLWWCWKDLWTWWAFMPPKDFWRSSKNQPRSQASFKRVERWRNRLWMSLRYSPHIVIWRLINFKLTSIYIFIWILIDSLCRSLVSPTNITSSFSKPCWNAVGGINIWI